VKARCRALHMLFIKSSNEWGEGAIMEPDQFFGRAFLRALERGLSL
jgi:hypothetical protein